MNDTMDELLNELEKLSLIMDVNPFCNKTEHMLRHYVLQYNNYKLSLSKNKFKLNSLINRYNIKNKERKINLIVNDSHKVSNITSRAINQVDNISTKLKKVFSTDVIEVDDVKDVPNTPLYFIKSKSVYALKLNDRIIYGNIGNIIENNKNIKRMSKCNNSECSNSLCKFYHDINNKHHDKEEFFVRNYHSNNWRYDNECKFHKVRRIGSKKNLVNDLLYSDKNEKSMRQSQLMHDILLYIILCNYLDEFDNSK